jgi:DnaJ-class molecular chaperone
MVRKETCPRCKGNRWVRIPDAPSGKEHTHKCPECGGQGYKIRMVR